MTQFGMYSTTTPRNDASPARGQWQLDNAYRYISEAYGGYHFDKMNGINVQAGIFMSYVGLWSYYNFDNWTYQPSYVSSNTPWFFNGMRVQIFPTDKLKIEPWLINGWQSYGKFNHAPGIGGQVLYRPNGSVSILFNNYWGTDTLGNPDRKRIHTDDSIQVKYYDKPDAAREPRRRSPSRSTPAASTAAASAAAAATRMRRHRPSSASWRTTALWFDKDRFALTVGGGAINNPGRYLVLMPPINGATAFSGTPYFTDNPGDSVQGVGHADDVRLHAEPVRHVPLRVQPPPRERAVLRGRGRRDAARWQHRCAGFVRARLYAGSAEVREPSHVRSAGQALTSGSDEDAMCSEAINLRCWTLATALTMRDDSRSQRRHRL